jgi:hypothetical protein
MTKTAIDFAASHRVRKGSVDFMDVPELGYVTVEGIGRPGGAEFTAAVQALYTVSYGARFLLKKERGDAPQPMPLEAQWWVDDPVQWDILAAVALGTAVGAGADRSRWGWRVMIVQPEPIDIDIVVQAIERARAKTLPALRSLRYERWEEGHCAQLLHVGPYSAESPSIVRLHKAIAEAGYRPRGRHHEIYLSDPRRCAPHKLRTILRHPIAPAS